MLGNIKKILIKKFETKEAKIGIIGLGYVGLPLMISFARAGFKTLGFDIDKKKIDLLNSGQLYFKHLKEDNFSDLVNHNYIEATSDYHRVYELDAIILCLPTPLNKNREPDISYITNSMKTIVPYLRQGQVISLESTTYPGMTEEEIVSRVKSAGFKPGDDYFIVYSPEREDPGNKDFSTTTITKIVGGYTPDCLEVGIALYDKVISRIVPVSNIRVAEMTKLLENIYRAVNIGLVNEMKIIADRMGIDIWEVIDAAATKPFGFKAFYPGPGPGGHCIPIDPFYLTWKARQYEFNTKFIELAGEINTNIPYYVVQKTVDALNQRNIATKNASILILGLAYKKDIDDIRESSSLKLIELFMNKGCDVYYNDPFISKIPKTRKYDFNLESVVLIKENLHYFDAIVISTNHSCYDYDFLFENSKLIIDTRNAFKGKISEKIIKA